MEPGARLRPNSPPILQETVDDDTIMVDLDSGSYFHLTGAGAFAWRLMDAGATQEAVATTLAETYGVDATQAARDLEALVAELLAEALVVAETGEAPAVAIEPPRDRAYAPPKLAKHTDMQELLLLDPVHDVDETGWPAARP